jgi:hypothetical protein
VRRLYEVSKFKLAQGSASADPERFLMAFYYVKGSGKHKYPGNREHCEELCCLVCMDDESIATSLLAINEC